MVCQCTGNRKNDKWEKDCHLMVGAVQGISGIISFIVYKLPISQPSYSRNEILSKNSLPIYVMIFSRCFSTFVM